MTPEVNKTPDSFDPWGRGGVFPRALRIPCCPPISPGDPRELEAHSPPCTPLDFSPPKSWLPWPRRGGVSPSRQTWGALVTPDPLLGGGLPSQSLPGYLWVLLGAPPWPEGRGCRRGAARRGCPKLWGGFPSACQPCRVGPSPCLGAIVTPGKAGGLSQPGGSGFWIPQPFQIMGLKLP